MSPQQEIRLLPLPQQLMYWARVRPDDVALRQKEFGVWRPVTFAEYAEISRRFGLGLLQLGLERAQRVAIIGENCREWAFAELGVAMVGGVTAGVYPTSPAPEVEYLLALCEASFIVCEDQEQLDKVLAVRERLPLLKAIVVIDPRGLRRYDRRDLHDFDDVVALGAAFESREPAEAARLSAGPDLDDIGLMVFTSGSTGRPKAAMLSWRGLGAAAQGLNSLIGCGARDSLVSYLPLCHVAEQMFSIHIPLATGATVNFAESLRTVQDDLREIAPDIFFGVPRIWEKFHAAIQTKIREAGGARLWLFGQSMRALERQAATPRSHWGLKARLTYGFWYLATLRALLNFVGLRRCRVAISSGAPIAPEILKFFRILGVPIREAYGLTEASGATTMQPGDASPVGTVGVPYAGVEVKLSEAGEILIRGDMVFRGYFRNEAATREAIDQEGWLRTGDVARWEEGPSGRELRIVDRMKDIMITAGGKNITPSEIENALRFSPYVKEAIIIADRRRFVSALIQLDFDSCSAWAGDRGITYTNYRSLAERAEIRELIQGEIDAVNARMPQVQQVRKFHILTRELDHDDGEVTATMKIRRSSISQKYAAVIDAMYA